MSDTRDPWPRLRQWLQEGGSASGVCTEMTLATATGDGVPSVRVVCLRGVDDHGLCFFTHAGSRKTRELDDNPRAAAVFYWPAAHRQLRIDGEVESLPRAAAEHYFGTRPRGAQIAAVVSRQGRPSPGLDVLRSEWAALEQRLGDAPVPCPLDFVGYRLVPSAIEFWQGDTDRLHDRITHLRDLRGGSWRALALQP